MRRFHCERRLLATKGVKPRTVYCVWLFTGTKWTVIRRDKHVMIALSSVMNFVDSFGKLFFSKMALGLAGFVVNLVPKFCIPWTECLVTIFHTCFTESWEYMIFIGTGGGGVSASATPSGKMGGEMKFWNKGYGVLGSKFFKLLSQIKRN